MNDNSKIKFYSMDGKILDNIDTNFDDFDVSKPIVASKHYNKALKSVIDKDIKFLSDKVSKLIKEVNIYLLKNGLSSTLNNNLTIDNINEVISSMEEVISSVIITNSNNKAKLFSTNKKRKKQDREKLEECINYLSKCQNDFISVKDEYTKLKNRSELIKCDDSEPSLETEDPLERTINFYMKKQERN